MLMEFKRSKKAITSLFGGKKGDVYSLDAKLTLGAEEKLIVAYASENNIPNSIGTFVVISDPNVLVVQKKFSSRDEITETSHVRLENLTGAGGYFEFGSSTIMANFETALLDGLQSVKVKLRQVSEFREFAAEAELRAVSGSTETIEI